MSGSSQLEVPEGIIWDQITLPEQHLWSSVPFFHHCRSPSGSQILSLTNIGGPALLQSIHEHFQHRDRDVHVVTYPKAGTSWLQEIVWLINNQANVERSLVIPSGQRTVYIELIRRDGEEEDRVKSLDTMDCPRHVKWHHPAWLLPQSVTQSAKIIYLYRNPKDTAVSWFHFQRMNKLYGFTGTFEEFLPLFMEDKVPYGSYWENVRSWWKLRDQKNIMILSYESLQIDIFEGIRKIAIFLDKQLSEEEVAKIAKHTSFTNMKANPMTNGSSIPKIEGESDFMRKGKVGDWKNYFSSEQNQQMENWIEKNNANENIPMVFEI